MDLPKTTDFLQLLDRTLDYTRPIEIAAVGHNIGSTAFGLLFASMLSVRNGRKVEHVTREGGCFEKVDFFFNGDLVGPCVRELRDFSNDDTEPSNVANWLREDNDSISVLDMFWPLVEWREAANKVDVAVAWEASLRLRAKRAITLKIHAKPFLTPQNIQPNTIVLIPLADKSLCVAVCGFGGTYVFNLQFKFDEGMPLFFWDGAFRSAVYTDFSARQTLLADAFDNIKTRKKQA